VWGPRIRDKAQPRSWTLLSKAWLEEFERLHRSDNRAHASTYGDCIGTVPKRQSERVGPPSREVAYIQGVAFARAEFRIHVEWQRT
jgi:hypothetical protein